MTITFPIWIIGAVIIICYAVIDFRTKKKLKTTDRLLAYAFLLYVTVVATLTLEALRFPPETEQERMVQLTPFNFIQEWLTFNTIDSWYFWNNARLIFFNFIMFMPYGVFLVWLWRIRKSWKAFIVLFGTSLLIESLQLVLSETGLILVRGFDVDDLIMNTSGGMIAFWLTKGLFRFKKRKRKKRSG